MHYLWKLLRQHVSPMQLGGFLLANMIGTAIILTGFQLYRDVRPVFTADDSFMRPQQVVVSKTIGPTSTAAPTFSAAEIDELSRQPFCRSVAPFTATAYEATATMSVAGTTLPATSLAFESVPDRFTGVSAEHWRYTPGDTIVPVVIPRAWLAVYNFGFARSQSLPAIGDALASTIRRHISVQQGRHHYEGRVVALSSRAATILVPQTFTEHTNRLYAPEGSSAPTRLIIEPTRPADERLTQWISRHHLQTDEDRLESSKTLRLFQLLTTVVVAVGLLISLLSACLLLLSIHLLMQKNREKTLTLLLLGYSPRTIARPYVVLTVVVSLVSVAIAAAFAVAVRPAYLSQLYALYPQLPETSILPTLALAALLAVVLLAANYIIIRRATPLNS